MNIAITGAEGFLGWHTAVRLRAQHGVNAVSLGRADFADPEHLASVVAAADAIIHLAGVNRATTDAEVEAGNVDIAQTLAAAIARAGHPVHVVYGNSVQSTLDNHYGRGKARAAELLGQAIMNAGGTFANVHLPNIFGEHGRPKYNSFVATFCSEIASGRKPQVIEDRPVSLLHAQRAAEVLIRSALRSESRDLEPAADQYLVSEVLETLTEFHETYSKGHIPALWEPFVVDLFNTYRSYMFPQHFPFKATVNTDQRGELFETVRFHGGAGQTFVSTTRPGVTRGEHYHLNKVERFFVLKGEAEIALRRVRDDAVIRFQLKGEERSFVDMPTMWVHNITNVGDDELITQFWADQLLNPASPDTYWEPVALNEELAR